MRYTDYMQHDIAGVMKLVNIRDSKSRGASLEGSSPSPGTSDILAFVIGVALGDGNLSNPNKRATRLRITCDTRYPSIVEEIRLAVTLLMPRNKVSLVTRSDNCVDVSCYSNKWEPLLGWRAEDGPKHAQNVHVPPWIFSDRAYITACLRGLFITDGSVYNDRGYIMANFTTIIQPLASDVMNMIKLLGFRPHCYVTCYDTPSKHTRYVIRISYDTETFLHTINCVKC